MLIDYVKLAQSWLYMKVNVKGTKNPVGKFDLGFKATSTFFGQIKLRSLL
jgi:hypothetical protein